MEPSVSFQNRAARCLSTSVVGMFISPMSFQYLLSFSLDLFASFACGRLSQGSNHPADNRLCRPHNHPCTGAAPKSRMALRALHRRCPNVHLGGCRAAMQQPRLEGGPSSSFLQPAVVLFFC